MSLTLSRTREPVLRPNGEFARLRDEIDRTFERLAHEPLGLLGLSPTPQAIDRWLPPLDVSETESEIIVQAELPGIPVKNLDISLSGTTLTITGEKNEMSEKKDKDFYQCERRFGSFRRVVELPDSIDADKIAAESDNGIVTIHIAKKPGTKPRHVEVKPVSKKVPVTG